MDYPSVLGKMMKTSKILINIKKLDEMEKYEKIGIHNFLFALEDFSIGYPTFALEDIPEEAYILINRLLDTEAIEKLKSQAKRIGKYRGIIFEDLGVFQIFKNYDMELIWFQNHFATNYQSINDFLALGMTSAIISNEITEEEILAILDVASKPLILNIYGKNQVMYSRRTLLTNFNKYAHLDDNKRVILQEKVTNKEFLAYESPYGTVLFNNAYFNYGMILDHIDDAKIKYYLIFNLDYEPECILNKLKEDTDNVGFLHTKTVYRLKDYGSKVKA